MNTSVAADPSAWFAAGDPRIEDDFDRFLRCWRHQDCGGCMRSDAGCAWCPQSTTCVPLPHAPIPLLLPYSRHYDDQPICPLPSERYELRTPALGCNCSSITLMTALVTCAATIVALLVLLILQALLAWLWPRLTLRSTGYELRIDDDVVADGAREGKVWVRERQGRWWQFWKRGDGGEYRIESEEVVGDQALDVGRRGWRGVWPFRLIAASKPVRWAEGRLPQVNERTRLLS